MVHIRPPKTYSFVFTEALGSALLMVLAVLMALVVIGVPFLLLLGGRGRQPTSAPTQPGSQAPEPVATHHATTHE